MMIITVQGPVHSKKGNAIAVITRALEAHGASVIVQVAETHNAEKLVRSDDKLTEALTGVKVLIMEQQT